MYHDDLLMIIGCLPLIGLPKKKVDFNPTQSIIQPLSIDDELWCNLTAEITRRKSTSSDTYVGEMIAPSLPPMATPERRPGRIIRLQRHFKKAMTRIRKVFHQSPPSNPADSSKNVESPSPATVPKIVVRRDSNVSSAKRLAAKRKRTSGVSVTDNELSETDWIHKFQSRNLAEPESNQITSELLEIFEHLTVSVSKRPRLDSIEPFSCRIRTC